jgi:hypothetical protein
MSKPNTEGCTEWSCMYHGGDNRFKGAHDEGCPIRSYTGFVLDLVDAAEKHEASKFRCTCPRPTQRESWEIGQ